MENIEISIDVIRVQTMMHAIHRDRISNVQLTRLSRFLFSKEFATEFIQLESSLIPEDEKQMEFQNIYLRTITPIELLN